MVIACELATLGRCHVGVAEMDKFFTSESATFEPLAQISFALPQLFVGQRHPVWFVVCYPADAKGLGNAPAWLCTSGLGLVSIL